MKHHIITATVAILWTAAMLDITFIPACQTDPLFRLLECAFTFILVPLLALAKLEKN